MKCLNKIGKYYEKLEKQGKAELWYRKGVDIAESENLPEISYSLNSIGRLYTKRNLHDKAAIYHKRAFNACLKFEDTRGMSYSLEGFFYANKRLGGLDSVKENVESFLKGDISIKGQLCIWFKFGEFLVWHGYTSKAKEAYHNALTISKEYGLQNNEFEILRNLVFLHRNLGEFAKSSEYGNQLLTLSKQMDEKKLIADALTTLSYEKRVQGDYRQAENQLLQAVEILRKGEDSAGNLAFSMNNLAITYTLVGDYERAIQLYQESLSLCKKENNPDGAAFASGGIAWVQRETGNLHEAKKTYQKCIEEFKNSWRSHPPVIIMLAMNEVEITLREKGWTSRALDLINYAKSISARESDWVRILLAQAKLFSAQLGKENEAKKYFKKALSRADEIGFIELKVETMVAWALFLARKTSISEQTNLIDEVRRIVEYSTSTNLIPLEIYARLAFCALIFTVDPNTSKDEGKRALNLAREHGMETAINRARELIDLVNQFEKGSQLIELVEPEPESKDKTSITDKDRQRASIRSAIGYLEEINRIIRKT